MKQKSVKIIFFSEMFGLFSCKTIFFGPLLTDLKSNRQQFYKKFLRRKTILRGIKFIWNFFCLLKSVEKWWEGDIFKRIVPCIVISFGLIPFELRDHIYPYFFCRQPDYQRINCLYTRNRTDQFLPTKRKCIYSYH